MNSNIVNVLSFDCGYDPLAVCVVSFDLNYKIKINEINKKISMEKRELEHLGQSLTIDQYFDSMICFVQKWIDIIERTVLNSIVVKKIMTINLLGKERLKNIGDEDKIARLKFQLLDIDKYIADHHISIDVVLCEDQQIPNKHIQTIRSIILYHYITPINISIDSKKQKGKISPLVKFVNPRIKNKICLSKDESLSHKTFVNKYSSNYTANKEHCKANMLYFLKVFDKEWLLNDLQKYPKAKQKKYHRDIGDSICQAIMWWCHEYPKMNLCC